MADALVLVLLILTPMTNGRRSSLTGRLHFHAAGRNATAVCALTVSCFKLLSFLFFLIVPTFFSISLDLKSCPTPGCKGRVRKAQRKVCLHCGKQPIGHGPPLITSATEYAKAISDVRKYLDKVRLRRRMDLDSLHVLTLLIFNCSCEGCLNSSTRQGPAP